MERSWTNVMSGNNHQAQADVVICNREGLHARPVMRFVDIASQYACRIRVQRDQQEVDGKSPMEMMLLAAPMGTKLRLTAEGEGAAVAIAALVQLIEAKFHEA